MTSLYQLSTEYQAAAAKMQDLELPPEVIMDTLEGMEGYFQDKAINVAMMIRNLESLEEQIKIEIDRMTARRKEIASRTNNLRDYLITNMLRIDIKKISDCPLFNISIKNNPPKVIIDDYSLIPEIMMHPPKILAAEPNKKRIAEFIESVGEVNWAHIEHGVRVDIK